MKSVEDNKKSSQVAGTTSEEKRNQLDATVANMMFTVLEQKLNSLLFADKYHRFLHTIYILLLLVLILFR